MLECQKRGNRLTITDGKEVKATFHKFLTTDRNCWIIYMVNGFKQFVKMSVCLGYVMVHVVICSDTTRPIYPEGLIPWLAHTALWSISKHFQLGKWTKSVPFTFLPSDFYNFWGRFHASREGVVPSIFLFPQRKVPLAENLFLLDMMNPVRRNTRMKKARIDIVLNQNKIQMSYVRTCTTWSS